MPPLSRFVPALLLLAEGLACSDSGGPRPIQASFSLSTINSAPPPVLVGTTLNCDQYLQSAVLDLNDDETFFLSAQSTIDCTATGGTVAPQELTVAGTYSRSGSTIVLQVPGAVPLHASYDGETVAATIPASPVTFPTTIDVVLRRLVPFSD